MMNVLGLIAGFFRGGISRYLVAVGAVAVLIIGGLGYWQYKEAQAARNNLAGAKAHIGILKDTVDHLNDSIAGLIERRRDDQNRMNELASLLREVEEQRDVARNRLDSHRGKLRDRAIKDPEDIGRRATRATRRLMLDVLRASGGSGANQSGGNREIPPPETGSGPPG